jgi:hypothetical protein
MFKKKKIYKGKKVNNFAKRNELENERKIKIESGERVKYFECSRYGHLRIECPNLKRNKGKALNITLSDEFDSENFNSSSNNEFVFVALSDTIKISYDSDTDQTISNYSDLNITFVITYHELSLQEAYKDLCEVVKVKKLNKKLFNKLTDMENNLAEALKLSKVEISRSLMKVKALENELTMCKQSQEPSAT